MDLNAFSHGQIQSKLWLCENLEPHLPDVSQVIIVGSWYNALGFMMLSRNPNKYNLILGVDKDQESVDIANKLMNGWMIGIDYKARNSCKDIEKMSPIEFGCHNVVINTSCEHMDMSWYKKVHEDQLVCIQTSNMVTDDPNWNVTNPNPSMNDFKSKYPMSQILFEGEKVFDYGHLVYSRYMLIGKRDVYSVKR